MSNFIYNSVLLILSILSCWQHAVNAQAKQTESSPIEHQIVAWKGANYVVIKTNPAALEFFLEANGQKFKSFDRLATHLEKEDKTLLFAMNGGMYLPDEDNEPQGLYIENSRVRTKLEPLTKQRPIRTNFYLHPNGIFSINHQNQAKVQSNEQFQHAYPNAVYKDIKFATQSGPMLVIDDNIHPAFTEKSKNIHIRNAVGITDNNEIYLVLSQERICFHDIASLFKEKLHCSNALYLDGFVSKLYYPKLKEYKNKFTGNFGTILGIYK